MREEGIVLDTKSFSLDEARSAREAFITSATSFVKPVVAIDGAPVADGRVGPVTRRLFAIFGRHVQGGLANVG
jgi:D-alanine transaminase